MNDDYSDASPSPTPSAEQMILDGLPRTHSMKEVIAKGNAAAVSIDDCGNLVIVLVGLGTLILDELDLDRLSSYD